jgi:hypothetical protein
MSEPTPAEQMEAASSAATDQIGAVLRDLSPGALVALVDRTLHAVHIAAEHLEQHGIPHASEIDLAACVGALAIEHLAEAVPKDDAAAKAALLDLMQVMQAAKAGPR